VDGPDSRSAGRDAIVAFDATALADPPGYVSGHMLRGIGRYIANLLSALQVERADWSDAHLRPVVTTSNPPIDGGRPIYTRRPRLRRQDIGWWTAWIADRVAIAGQGVALWHGLDPNMPLSPLPARRTVMTAYDLIALHEPSAMAQIRPHRRLVYRLYLRRLRSARLVIAISEVTARDLRATLGIAPERIRVIYPAVPLPPPAVRAADAHGQGRDLLFVGVPDPTKQPELALATLAACRARGHQVRLRFAGYHRPGDRARLTALAAGLGVSDSVEFLGRVDDSRLTELYRSSVLLALSHIEGFGLPPVEALLAGGRVVAGEAPVYRETLGDAADYSRSPSGDGLADAYEAALSRPEETPPPALVERHSPRATAAALVSAYQEAMA
jgi:glycosyltransferase involved in cell wall biosynthesis